MQQEEEAPAAVQGSPATVQELPDGWPQVPLLHTPVQQAPGSAVEQLCPVCLHRPDAAHCPPTQLSEQQSPEIWQLPPTAAQVLPVVQRKAPEESSRHTPVQHSTAETQVAPAEAQVPPS